MNTPRRAPRAVAVELTGEKAQAKTHTAASVQLSAPEIETVGDMDFTEAVSVPVARRSWWRTIFWSTLSLLVSALLAQWLIDQAMQLWAAQGWFSYAILALLTAVSLSGVILVVGELLSLRRLARIDRLRRRHAEYLHAAAIADAKGFAQDIALFYADRPDLARPRAELSSHLSEIMDPPDYLRLTESTMMAPLDKRAAAAVEQASRRVSVVTAVSPRALIDVAFVIWQSARLIREIAEIYGGRLGLVGQWRLFRVTLSHLAVTGSIAVGETLLQQLIGQSLAGRLSAKLGEGVVNGLMTARIGLSAIDICRPMAFDNLSRPTLRGIMSRLVPLSDAGK